MSQTRSNSESKALSNSNYQHIFSVALESYKERTGKDLTSNPLLPRLENCNSPDSVIGLLREQVPGFNQSRVDNNSERLTNWLNPTVKVITAFSGTISDTAGQVGPRVFYLICPEYRG
jgi:fungal STAND N-terminal Goodbye domain